jgi:hypothetical protein
VIFSDVFLEIEKTNERKITENFKIYPIKQYELYNEGLEKEEGQMYASYVGNKWGGIYLRAPEIFFKILEKGKDKLVRLGNIAKVISGIITGDNKHYYTPFVPSFNKDKYVLAFKSPKDVDKIICTSNDVKWLLKKESRFLSEVADFLIGDTKNDRFIVINFKPEFKKEDNILMLNSTLFILFTEMFGKSNLGQGALYLVPFDIKRMIVINPKFLEISISENLNRFLNRPIKSIFEELGFPKCTQRNCNHPEHPYENVKLEEVSFDRIMLDRRELDRIIFEAIGLNEEEQLEVYRTVVELVKNRLLKAKRV